MAVVSALLVYPLKSARGVPMDVLELDDRGPRMDRRWMAVDDQGKFLSQRRIPALALIAPSLTREGLLLSAQGMPPLLVREPDDAPGTPAIEGHVYGGSCRVLLASPAAGAWLTRVLGVSARLVFQPESTVLPMSPDYAGSLKDQRRIALTDGSPLLLIGQASLDDLNCRLETPVPMNRFRPNVVVQGTAPFEEDEWETIAIGEVEFEVSRACIRCVTTTIDQATGEKGVEPLRTLATYRKAESGVNFGQNLSHHAPGMIRVGDSVRVVVPREH